MRYWVRMGVPRTLCQKIGRWKVDSVHFSKYYVLGQNDMIVHRNHGFDPLFNFFVIHTPVE